MNKEEIIEALKSIKIRCHSRSMKYDPIDFDLDIIEKSLKALEIIKGTFMWLEDNPYVIYVGRINDIETMLTEEDFKNEEEFNLLKEVLK